jgi:hypothetical protein
MKYSLAWVFIALAILMPTVSHAQLASDLQIQVTPINPQPFTEVSLKAVSYELNLDESRIVWKVDGVTVRNGFGEKTISVRVGASGTKSVVSIEVSNSSRTETATVVVQPTSVDMLWEAVDGYTPPFYKGKALPANGGYLRVTAIPPGGNFKTNTFNWKRNDVAQPQASGYGKASFSFAHNELNNVENVIVSTIGGIGVINITPRAPSIIAYERSEGFINYAQGFRNGLSLNRSMILRFEPYYYSVPRSLATDISFSFLLNGTEPELVAENEVALLKPESSGETPLTARVRSNSYSFQSLEKIFRLQF